MDDILDEITYKTKSSRFSNLALISGIITLVCLITMANQFSGTIKASEGIPMPSIIQIRGTQIFGLLGIIFTVLSLIKKEPWNWKKWLSTILNIVLFVVIFGSICFYYFIEFTR